MTTWNTSLNNVASGFTSHGQDHSLGAAGRAEMAGDSDAVEAYFECISTCSLDDAECITVCTTVLRENN
jgi:hypothetical protein